MRQQHVSMKCASISENVPRGLPGKQRFRSRLIDRRQARVVENRRHVDRRHHDDAALDRGGLERLRQARDGDLALILVAVHAAREQHGRSTAVLHADDRDLDRAPAGRVARQRRAQIARLPSVLVEIDVAPDPALVSALTPSPARSNLVLYFV